MAPFSAANPAATGSWSHSPVLDVRQLAGDACTSPRREPGTVLSRQSRGKRGPFHCPRSPQSSQVFCPAGTEFKFTPRREQRQPAPGAARSLRPGAVGLSLTLGARVSATGAEAAGPASQTPTACGRGRRRPPRGSDGARAALLWTCVFDFQDLTANSKFNGKAFEISPLS